MQNSMNSAMGGSGLWTVLGISPTPFLIVAIVRMEQKK